MKGRRERDWVPPWGRESFLIIFMWRKGERREEGGCGEGEDRGGGLSSVIS